MELCKLYSRYLRVILSFLLLGLVFPLQTLLFSLYILNSRIRHTRGREAQYHALAMAEAQHHENIATNYHAF